MARDMVDNPMVRSSSRIPPHIEPEKLPANVYYDPRGRGRWVHRKSNGRKNQGKETRLGDGAMTMADIWARVDMLLAGTDHTFKAIGIEFQRSSDWAGLSWPTQRDYENCHKAICGRKTRTGDLLGDIPLDAWTPGAVRRYRDARAKESKSRAAHEIRYMKRVFKWAISYDLTSDNPAKEIDLKGLVEVRDHYVQDVDYQAMLNMAPWRVACAAHLAYLTGRRRRDILGLTRANVQPEGLLLQEGKTGKHSLILWSDELRQVIDFLLESGDFTLFSFTAAAFDTAWQRVRVKLRAAGFVPFQFKDLRAKHASDLEEIGVDATANLLHADGAVTRRHYLRKAKKVVSLR